MHRRGLSRPWSFLFPPEQVIFEWPQHAHFENGHHHDQRDRPCEYLIRLYEIRSLPEPISYTARGTERLRDERHAPAETEGETRAREEIGKDRRQVDRRHDLALRHAQGV